jgi:hypothetical protein
MVAMGRSAVVLVGGLLLGACAKGGGGAPGAAPNEQKTAGATPATQKAAESAEFDQKRGTKVDAPSFQGTSLPTCVSAMVSHWAFPKSQTGSLATSYPFVFVGGSS